MSKVKVDYQDMKAYREASAFIDELMFKVGLLHNPDFIMMPNGHLLRWREMEHIEDGDLDLGYELLDTNK